MIMEEQDSGLLQWGLHFFECDPYLPSGYHGAMVQHDANDMYNGQYFRDHSDAECNQKTLNIHMQEKTTCNIPFRVMIINEGYECGQDESDDTGPSCSCSSPGEEDSFSLELSGECMLDEQVEKRLNQMIPIPHVPRINGEIPSIDEATTYHERLLSRLRSNGFVELKVQGDGNCQFCALSDQLYNTPEHHKYVRRQVVNQLKSHQEIYEGYVPMEYGEYLKKMSKSGEWGDNITLQAAADLVWIWVDILFLSFKFIMF
ncbi:OVARIAN TUMOR DOMAIN-containing deubiquitinating enzyme 12-like isoform X3 [Mangifera indica]|uniref:OVARIAN TUMOR DOMAIN-containing deubiquitinating enzyme 12-like isoform X3 n=1 Tax=Mangifera indica TaxID=29780 RepID=UPI001CFB9E8F|nr:OVARIAN TUMOR DOMAIN-containing deubiquitinating enzyme 12-like isoform X3 [Mangifera indica]